MKLMQRVQRPVLRRNHFNLSYHFTVCHSARAGAMKWVLCARHSVCRCVLKYLERKSANKRCAELLDTLTINRRVTAAVENMIVRSR
jgi:hypothetical protein